jgi:hypothetical protein
MNVYVNKVSSGFEYSLLTFAPTLGLAFYMLGSDAELNSASNGDMFEGEGHRPKIGIWR